MKEDLNLTGNDTDIKIVHYITRSCITWIQHNKLSCEAQMAIDAREIIDLDAQFK